MVPHIENWAGSDRPFILRAGDVMDLEQACGKKGIGAIFIGFVTGTYSISEVMAVLELALAGGGLPIVEARALVRNKIEDYPLVRNASLAAAILMGLMEGIEPVGDDGKGDDPAAPMKASDVLQLAAHIGISPEDIRATRYSDLVNMIHGMNTGDKDKIEPPTEDEFLQMLADQAAQEDANN